MGSAYTVSVSMDDHAEEHSRRSYTPMSADRALADRNIVIFDCGNDREHFNAFFRPHIEEYNSKQKRSDRKKDLDYISALESGREGYGRGKRHEKPYFHEVIQIGNRDSNGVTDAEFDDEKWKQMKRDGKYDQASEYVKDHLNDDKAQRDFKEILTEIAQEMLENKDGLYTGILIHGLIIHDDEPNGTLHLDVRGTFTTSGEKTGLGTRVSQTKCLDALGYMTDKESTALEKYREAIKDRIEEKMTERGYQREKKGEHRAHLKTAVYGLKRDYERLLSQVQNEEEKRQLLQEMMETLQADVDGLQAEKTEAENIIKKAEEKDVDLKRRESDLEFKDMMRSLRESSVKIKEQNLAEKEKAIEVKSQSVLTGIKHAEEKEKRVESERAGLDRRKKELDREKARLEQIAVQQRTAEAALSKKQKDLEDREAEIADEKREVDDLLASLPVLSERIKTVNDFPVIRMVNGGLERTSEGKVKVRSLKDVVEMAEREKEELRKKTESLVKMWDGIKGEDDFDIRK